ncbi:ArsR/SmtB family transcription factor [Amycolatopsis pigmentata]|uniref:ArsR/SmtB family transcription factor n=1 Tax=Amycolatopsis pigmentata TaxID=450801 RepID=A0ABW5G2J6_9PSEU
MIRIRLDAWTLARTRIAISPLNDLVSGLYLLLREQGRVPWPYTEWAATAREVLRTVPEVAPLRIYAQLHGRSHERRVPDVFTPMPLTSAPSIADELSVLRRTDRTTVAEQFTMNYPEGVPQYLEPFLDDPDRAFGQLADACAAYWDLTLASRWPVMRTALEEEVLLRARALAADGPDALLADLRGQVRWEPPVLSLVKPVESAFDAVGRRLLLVPLIFAQGILMCSTDLPDTLMVTYQARGTMALAGPSSPEHADDRLAVLLGAGRAAVLRALTEPATTTGLATALGLAPSTVSEHLSILQAAGAVHRRRAGRRVLYELQPTGMALVSLLTDERSHSAG